MAFNEFASYSPKRIDRLMKNVDGYRNRFIKNHFNRCIDDPSLYHLVINFSLLPPEKVIDVIVNPPYS